jgi:uncharacterized repeat protein (TIGR02543 family)
MRSDLLATLALAATVAACGGSSSSSGTSPANLSMTPNVGYTGAAVPVVISGTGFLAKVTQPQGGGQPVLDTQHRAWLGSTELGSVTWIGTTTLNAIVPAGMAPGEYDLTVENALGNRGTAKGAYAALATPPFSATATVDHSTVNVGQTLTLTVTVTNGSSDAITGFQLGVPTVSSSDGGSAGPPSAQPPAPSSLAAGAKQTFTWTYVPTTPGHASIVIVITGVQGGKTVTAALAAPATALIQLPALLTPSWIGQPSTQTVGIPVSLTLELANAAGAATASVTALTPTMNPATSVSCTAVDPAPSTAVPIQIAGGASQRFTWSCTATTFGSYVFGATVAATDLNTGGALSVSPPAVPVNYTTDLVLVIAPAGDGSGTVNSSPAGINGCTPTGGTCTAIFVSGTVVTLTAAPATGSTLVWSGCTPVPGNANQCTVTIDGAKTVTATFTLVQEALTITPPTDGTITCNGGCQASYGYGSTVTLTATPSPGFSFGAWTGACSATTGATCTLTMTAPMTVGATFTANVQDLTVSASPAAGTTGITCSANGGAAGACAATYPTGTSLTIAAPPAAGYSFTGWSGGTCSGTGACSFTMPSHAVTVTASFSANSQGLTVTASPTGTGTFSCSGTGVATNCTSAPTGAQVTVHETPSSGYTFSSWSGVTCNGGQTGASCTFTMPAGSASVTGTFTGNSQTLSVTASPTGTGTFSCSGTGVAANCTSAPTGAQVTVSETPSSGYTFSSWSGVTCNGGQTGTSCTFTMPAGSASVTGTFTGNSQTLSVTASPTGTGTFSCSGTGVATNCTSAPTGAQVTVHETPSSGYSFSSWSGVTCNGGQTGTSCTFTMPAGSASVTGTFTGNAQTLTVTANPLGAGTFNCSGAGVAGDCTSAPTGAQVTVNETPVGSFVFSAWSGACAGTGACVFTMPAGPASVTASFL